MRAEEVLEFLAQGSSLLVPSSLSISSRADRSVRERAIVWAGPALGQCLGNGLQNIFAAVLGCLLLLQVFYVSADLYKAIAVGTLLKIPVFYLNSHWVWDDSTLSVRCHCLCSGAEHAVS